MESSGTQGPQHNGELLAETQLRYSEERFRVLLDNLPAVAIQGYDANGTVHYWNRGSEVLYGYSSSQAVGKQLVDLIVPPELQGYVQAAIENGAKTGEMPPPAEVTLMRADGSPIPVFCSHAVVSLPDHPPELFCIDINLTPQKEAERNLRLREQAFVDMAENSPNVIMRYDSECRHLYVNPAITELIDLSPDQWIGKTHSELGFPAELCLYWEEKIRLAFTTAEAIHDEFEFESTHGRAVIDWRLIPETNKNGDVVTVLSVSRNVTAEKRTEEELRSTADMLKQSQEQLRRLGARTVHVKEEEQRRIAQRIHDDFGQRLTMLTLDLTWLRDTLCPHDSEAHQRVEGSLKEIQDLLALARDISTDLRPAVLDHFGLPAALEWSAETFASSTGVGVDVDVNNQIRFSQTTESALFRIVKELLTNITRHAQAHHVSLSLQEKSGTAHLVVSDDGSGLDGDASRDMTSMGLLAMQETALSIGASIDIRSARKQGTTACISIPLPVPQDDTGRDSE